MDNGATTIREIHQCGDQCKKETMPKRSNLRLQRGDVVSYLLGLGEKVLYDWLLLKDNGLRRDDPDGRRVILILLPREGVGIFTGRLGGILGPLLQLRQAVPHGPSGRGGLFSQGQMLLSPVERAEKEVNNNALTDSKSQLQTVYFRNIAAQLFRTGTATELCTSSDPLAFTAEASSLQRMATL